MSKPLLMTWRVAEVCLLSGLFCGAIGMAWSDASIVRAADEWTRFRGANGAGISADVTIPSKWTEKDYAWSINLPGKGLSSPVIWGERLFITAADEAKKERYLLCIDTKSGQTLWTKAFAFSPYKKHKRNGFATSTPAVDGERVYAAWHSPDGSELIAVTHEGKDAWTSPLPTFSEGHGGGTSPIVYGELVVIGHDAARGGCLIAVDRATGQSRWKIEREPSKATYSVPCVYKGPSGKDELIFTNFDHGITSVDPASGKRNWELSVFGKDEERRSIGSPIVAGDLVIGVSGFAGGKKILAAVKPGTDGKPTEVYKLDRSVAHMPTTLVKDGLLFIWDDKGIVTCANAANGEQIWQQRVGGSYAGSPICVGERLFIISDDGEVVVIAAAREFAELGRVDLKEGSAATPAVAGGRLFLRTHSKLHAVAGKK